MAAGDAPDALIGSLSGGTMGPWGGVAYVASEHVPDLAYPLSVQTFGKMRHDPTLTSVIAAYAHPILRASWAVDPRGADDRTTRIVADSLGLPVLGDNTPGPVRTRGVKFREHLRMAVLALVFGHMGFEPRYEIRDGAAYLAALPERMPNTLTDILVNDAGDLLGVKQAAVSNRVGARDVTIPYDDDPAQSRLLWYVHQREGSAWQGQSMLRAAFGPWLLKQDMLRVNATSIRRFGAGTPVAEPLPGTAPTPAQITEAQRMVSAIRVGESGGAVPVGFRVRILGVEGTLPDALPTLRYHDEQMARAALTSVLDLGNTSNGSRALGDTFASLLAQAQQSVGEMLADTMTRVSVALTTYNAGDDANAPAITVGDVAGDRRLIAQSIAQLMQVGAVTADPELEAWVREAYNLPEREAPVAPVRPIRAVPTPLAGEEPVAARRRVRAATQPGGPYPAGSQKVTEPGWPYRRQMNSVELKAGFDPEAVDAEADALIGDLLTEWPKLTAKQRADLLDQIEAAVEDGDLTALAALTVDSSETAGVLAAAMTAAAAAGAAAVVAEARSQGVKVPAPALDEDMIAARAAAQAALMGSSLAAAAGREALRIYSTARGAADVAADVDTHLASLTEAWLKDQLAGAVNGGMNSGRISALAAAPGEPRFFASELRDKNTCQACMDLDGTEFESLAVAEVTYANGGYVDCEGGYRCRGVLLTVYGDPEE